jgi:hypothetical protein
LEEQRSALDTLYCPTNGRPADDPVCLLGVLLLQVRQSPHDLFV